MFAFAARARSLGIKIVPPLSMNRTDCRKAWGRMFTFSIQVSSGVAGDDFIQVLQCCVFFVVKVAGSFYSEQSATGSSRVRSKRHLSGHCLGETGNAVNGTAAVETFLIGGFTAPLRVLAIRIIAEIVRPRIMPRVHIQVSLVALYNPKRNVQ